MTTRVRLLPAALLLGAIALPSSGSANQNEYLERIIYVISDTHMGLGLKPDGKSWHETEDFRWSSALSTFLDRISRDHGHRVDLVIAGDFLELWQTPDEIDCSPIDTFKNHGCSVAEATRLTKMVVEAHKLDLEALAAFAARGDNCVHVVPGNHDAALMEDEPWEPVRKALTAQGGCVERADRGFWRTQGNEVHVEHGHQIGRDANRFPDWPRVAENLGRPEGAPASEQRYFLRPLGEVIVQEIVNSLEREVPMIDNLMPNSAAMHHVREGMGTVKRAKEYARLVVIGLGETSFRQRLSGLGDEDNKIEPPNADAGRALGVDLVIAALKPGDPLAQRLSNPSADWRAVREAVDLEVRQLPDDEVLALCDLAREISGEKCLDPNQKLGFGLQERIFSRERIIGDHIKGVWSDARIEAFAYGHTHSFELPWKTEPASDAVVEVSNSGGFQRLIDNARLLEIAKEEKLSAIDALNSLTFDKLAPCYTAIKIEFVDYRPRVQLRAWLAEEGDPGEFVGPCDPRCPSVGHGCQ